MAISEISRPVGGSNKARAPRGVRRSTLGAMLVLVVAYLATSPLTAAAATNDEVATRIEVVVDGFQNAPAQTFQAVSFDGGIANTSSTAGGGSGKAVLENLVVTKAIDDASPLLLDAARTGIRLRSVTVRVFQRAPRDTKETLVLEVTATNVLVALTHEAASTVADATRASERVDFTATTATFAYPLQDRTVTFGAEPPTV